MYHDYEKPIFTTILLSMRKPLYDSDNMPENLQLPKVLVFQCTKKTHQQKRGIYMDIKFSTTSLTEIMLRLTITT